MALKVAKLGALKRDTQFLGQFPPSIDPGVTDNKSKELLLELLKDKMNPAKTAEELQEGQL